MSENPKPETHKNSPEEKHSYTAEELYQMLKEAFEKHGLSTENLRMKKPSTHEDYNISVTFIRNRPARKNQHEEQSRINDTDKNTNQTK